MKLLARDVMQTIVKKVDPEMTLADLERTLLAERISGAPVVDDGRLVGIVSRSDIVRQLSVERTLADVAHDYYHDVPGSAEEAVHASSESVAKRLASLRVKDAMIRNLLTVPPDAPIDVIARDMVKRRIHRMLVTQGELLIGIISTLDLVQLIADGRLTSS